MYYYHNYLNVCAIYRKLESFQIRSSLTKRFLYKILFLQSRGSVYAIFFFIKRDSNKSSRVRARETIKTTLIRSKFIVPEKAIAIGGDGGQLNAERPWIIERERGRASETTWLLLTNAIWPASGASRALSLGYLFASRACGKKEKRTGKQSAVRIGRMRDARK